MYRVWSTKQNLEFSSRYEAPFTGPCSSYYLAQRAAAVQLQATALSVRVLPVCHHRSVRYPLGTPTSAINQTIPVAAVEACYVLRTQPQNMNHNADFSLPQQTADYSHTGYRSLIIFYFLTHVRVYIQLPQRWWAEILRPPIPSTRLMDERGLA